MKIKGINIKLGKKDIDNAPLIVSKLIKDRSSEKEKFDAIFSWVAKNIQYNESFFYKTSESGPNAIAKILQNRKTICLGYAQLMDSLCQLAGITNVIVFGYAKDRFYDIRDSIYGHNHAWNAVKLEDLWYVYDITWSKGVSEYKYTKKALLIIKLLNKFPEKFKKKTLHVPRKFRKKSICREKIKPIVYYKPKFLNSLFRIWLMTVPIKVVKKHDKGISKDFYLTNPMLFSATHVPDDPMWDFLGRKKCYEYEQDSSFYYLTDTSYKHQERKGESCLMCDDYYVSSLQKKIEILNQNSLSFNFNNKFITSYCFGELAKILFFKSLNANDNRLNLVDSSVLHCQNAVNNIGLARNNLVKFFKYEKIKNDTKAKLLLKDNANHLKFVKNKVKITLQHNKSFQELLNKSSAFGTIYYNNINKVERFRIDYDFEKIKPYSDERIKELNNAHLMGTQQLDSLHKNISVLKNQFDSIITNLSLNIWPQVFRNDSIFEPFIKCIKMRSFFLDNYKKPIVDVRKKIYPMEQKYTSEIDNLLYNPSLECEKLFDLITKQIKIKQTLLNDVLKIKLELVKARELTFVELNDFKTEVTKDGQSDFCWLSVNYPKEAIVLRGLDALSRKQNYGLKVINFENETERTRQRVINKELKLGYKESNKDVANDTRIIKKKYKEIMQFRKEISDPKIFNKKRYDKIFERLMKLYSKN